MENYSTKMELVQQLSEDKEFMADLAKTENVSEVVALFAQNGIEISEEDLVRVMPSVSADGELDESALEQVNGGWVGFLIAIAGVCAGASAARGFFDALGCK